MAPTFFLSLALSLSFTTGVAFFDSVSGSCLLPFFVVFISVEAATSTLPFFFPFVFTTPSSARGDFAVGVAALLVLVLTVSGTCSCGTALGCKACRAASPGTLE